MYFVFDIIKTLQSLFNVEKINRKQEIKLCWQRGREIRNAMPIKRRVNMYLCHIIEISSAIKILLTPTRPEIPFDIVCRLFADYSISYFCF